jgi:hypothetical protein
LPTPGLALDQRRVAGRQPDEQEGQQRDAKKRRDDQQQAAQDVGRHETAHYYSSLIAGCRGSGC